MFNNWPLKKFKQNVARYDKGKFSVLSHIVGLIVLMDR